MTKQMYGSFNEMAVGSGALDACRVYNGINAENSIDAGYMSIFNEDIRTWMGKDEQDMRIEQLKLDVVKFPKKTLEWVKYHQSKCTEWFERSDQLRKEYTEYWNRLEEIRKQAEELLKQPKKPPKNYGIDYTEKQFGRQDAPQAANTPAQQAVPNQQGNLGMTTAVYPQQ